MVPIYLLIYRVGLSFYRYDAGPAISTPNVSSHKQASQPSDNRQQDLAKMVLSIPYRSTPQVPVFGGRTAQLR
jgi:hypothetical protein